MTVCECLQRYFIAQFVCCKKKELMTVKGSFLTMRRGQAESSEETQGQHAIIQPLRDALSVGHLGGFPVHNAYYITRISQSIASPLRSVHTTHCY